ncbi:MAG: hypothetical protein COW32_10130 [Candidatus Aquicultor secundus]|nr:MAG: hypothetical protein COT10_05220 [Candidatus Aquicultor secundus]PIW21401.1 MAG: hypothetical protein COW32_10130 [Candidatus Aquicultor secundus]PIX52461.1 MAG: hypothetical protein COZ51_04000 [Candidatus Aquicultor secundus]PIY40176.1 MAG: hypothetical protein COZ03_04625 [Candidatus Aquicultor secundus]PJB80275.1 MAG: hypothetical protein CO091_01645 [Candidatus Aquicultor secundus]
MNVVISRGLKMRNKTWIYSLSLIILLMIASTGCTSTPQAPKTQEGNLANQPLKLTKEFKFDKKKTGEFVEGAQLGKDFPLSTTYGYYYVYSMSALGQEIKKQHQDKLISALKKTQAEDGGFTWDTHTKGSDMYDTYCAVWTLKKLGALDQMDTAKVEEFIKSCSNKDGGFCLSPGQESRPIDTYYCVATLNTLGKLSSADKSSIEGYLKPLQAKDGGFALRKDIPGNVQCTYAALHVLNMMDLLDIVDKEKTTAFLVSDQAKDGGFGYMVGDKNINSPENAYYVLSSLRLLDSLDKIKAKPLSTFLKDRYVGDGGFCDVYYGNSKYPSTYYGIGCLAELGYVKNP